AAAARLAAAARSAVAAAAQIRSPSRVFIELGQLMAAGLAEGLDAGQLEVERAGRRLVNALSEVMSSAQADFQFDPSDSWWNDFSARVNAEQIGRASGREV